MGSAAATNMLPSIDVEAVLAELTQYEKVDLLAGRDFWHTVPIPRLGVPSLRMTDGPNGARGTQFFHGVPASCFPCATALASSWDPELIERVGRAMGDECIAKGAHVWLAPTMNTQRSPLGGRGFESFSEDPLLQGRVGAAMIAGVQSKGVAATQKHYVANDCEFNRMSSNSQLSEKALRQIYLKPFEIVCSSPNPPWATMTAYNRVNHVHASESKRLLTDILRQEWGWDGVIMSDWTGTYSTIEALRAGLDLEMPGPSVMRGSALHNALSCGKLDPSELDAPVRRILTAVKRAQDFGLPFDAPETSIDTPESRETLTTAAAESIVLLRNDLGVLPLPEPASATKATDKKYALAVIGPNAKSSPISGGGSAALRSTYSDSIYDAIVRDSGLAPSQIGWARGCYGHLYLPALGNLIADAQGRSGHLDLSFYADNPASGYAKPVYTMSIAASGPYFFVDGLPDTVPTRCYAVAKGTFTPDREGEWDFGLYAGGRANLYLDGKLLVDNSTNPTLGDAFFATASQEVRERTKVSRRPYNLRVEFSNHNPIPRASPFFGRGGIGFGACPALPAATMREEAVALARSAQDVVLVVGLNHDWEAESHDRASLALPPSTDELIAAVLEANPRAVLVLQSGTPVKLPPVPTALTAWYGGNATGAAVTRVLFGRHNPHARLPLTFPLRDEDTPTFGTFPETHHNGFYGTVEYVEGHNVGYRHYDLTRRPVAFEFGHGLSYTTFEWGQLILRGREACLPSGNQVLNLQIEVRNTGTRAGRECVQIYHATRDGVHNLVAFALTRCLQPTETEVVSLTLRASELAHWDDRAIPATWAVPAGEYTLRAGRSSRVFEGSPVSLPIKGFTWRGLVPALKKHA